MSGFDEVRHELLCRHCGERIGVYEPMIHVAEQGAARTSRLAVDPERLWTGECYHAACWQQAAS